ncbi:MAG: ABC transporter ATP-binding protein [Provencibacterium sp.]|jgi:ABC-type cobalamin/Fe3+-siderophores transport system ATPase subunit|nr:ABC transporter ATP-binding protein [Provencibacterium sp.]
MIEFQAVSAGYEGRAVLRRISLQVRQGEVLTVIGPNGCGKSTLLRAAARQLPLMEGSIRLNGREIGSFGRTEFARAAAFLPQARSLPAITVQALVSHGRYPYLGLSRRLRAGDREAIRRAMEQTGVDGWAGRELRALSGGERQRVYIAMALAQGTEAILLDEPTTYLDMRHQFEILELIRRLAGEGKAVLMVLHDLGHALRYSDRVALMEEGRIAACAAPRELAESGQIDRVFRIVAHRQGENYFFTAQGR